MTCTQEAGLYKTLAGGQCWVGVGSLWCTLLSCSAQGLSRAGGAASPCGERLDTLLGRDVGLLEWQQKEPQNKDLDQDEMFPGLLVNAESWKAVESLPSSAFTLILAAQLIPPSYLCWPKLWGSHRLRLDSWPCRLLVCMTLGSYLMSSSLSFLIC